MELAVRAAYKESAAAVAMAAKVAWAAPVVWVLTTAAMRLPRAVPAAREVWAAMVASRVWAVVGSNPAVRVIPGLAVRAVSVVRAALVGSAARGPQVAV